MKNLKTTALMCLLALGFAACSFDDDDLIPGGGDPPAEGLWKVSYFFDKTDETADYSGYTFEFEAGGLLTARQGGQTWTGTWSTGFDDSKDKFLMNFPGIHPSALEELEEDWLIIEQTGAFMHFEHTSGGNGDTDVLKFVKD